MKKCLILISIFAVVIVFVVGLAARLIVTKEFLVCQIEESIDARVQIGELNVSLFSVPTSVALRNVIIDSADETIQETPYADRAPLTSGVIELHEVEFEVSLGQLFSRKIYVDRFELNGLHAQLVLNEDGTTNLDTLFSTPVTEAVVTSKKEPGFNAKEREEFVTHLDSIAIKNVSFDLLIEKTGVFVKGTDCGLQVEGIEVNPSALEQVNTADLDIQCRAELFDSVSQSVKYGELGLRGTATARLFNPSSGVLDPELELDLAIDDRSYINSSTPYLEKVWKKAKKVEKYGLNLGALPEKATFGRSKKIAGRYHRGRVDLAEDLSVVVHDWEGAINAPSWLASGDETHAFYIDLSASKKASDSLMKHMDSLVAKLPKEVRGGAREQVKAACLKDGKLTLSLQTSGLLSAPRIDIATEFPNFDDLIKEYAKKSAIDYLFKKLGR